MSFNHCHLVEEAEGLRPKLMAGTMHRAGWPRGDISTHGPGGVGWSGRVPLSDPGPGSVAM